LNAKEDFERRPHLVGAAAVVPLHVAELHDDASRYETSGARRDATSRTKGLKGIPATFQSKHNCTGRMPKIKQGN
jgi:hypothetical protein